MNIYFITSNSKSTYYSRTGSLALCHEPWKIQKISNSMWFLNSRSMKFMGRLTHETIWEAGSHWGMLAKMRGHEVPRGWVDANTASEKWWDMRLGWGKEGSMPQGGGMAVAGTGHRREFWGSQRQVEVLQWCRLDSGVVWSHQMRALITPRLSIISWETVGSQLPGTWEVAGLFRN